MTPWPGCPSLVTSHHQMGPLPHSAAWQTYRPLYFSLLGLSARADNISRCPRVGILRRHQWLPPGMFPPFTQTRPGEQTHGRADISPGDRSSSPTRLPQPPRLPQPHSILPRKGGLSLPSFSLLYYMFSASPVGAGLPGSQQLSGLRTLSTWSFFFFVGHIHNFEKTKHAIRGM